MQGEDNIYAYGLRALPGRKANKIKSGKVADNAAGNVGILDWYHECSFMPMPLWVLSDLGNAIEGVVISVMLD